MNLLLLLLLPTPPHGAIAKLRHQIRTHVLRAQHTLSLDGTQREPTRETEKGETAPRQRQASYIHCVHNKVGACVITPGVYLPDQRRRRLGRFGHLGGFR